MKAISSITTSENLPECETAVRVITKAWLDDHLVEKQLSNPSVIEGMLELLFASTNEEILELIISLLTELVSKNPANGRIILTLDPRLDGFTQSAPRPSALFHRRCFPTTGASTDAFFLTNVFFRRPTSGHSSVILRQPAAGKPLFFSLSLTASLIRFSHRQPHLPFTLHRSRCSSPPWPSPNNPSKRSPSLPLVAITAIEAIYEHKCSAHCNRRHLRNVGGVSLKLKAHRNTVGLDTGSYSTSLINLNSTYRVGLAFHEYGGNHSGGTPIPLPQWVLEIGKENKDIFFTYYDGRRSTECLSWGLITAVEIGLGESGELKYSSFSEKKDGGILVLVSFRSTKKGNSVREHGKILMAAGDTFRAAASDQLGIWAERTGCEIVLAEKEKAKAPSVLSQAVKKGKEQGFDIVLCDTSGRLHTNYSLMEELIACKKAVAKLVPVAPNVT
ncbi:hypothetical protein L1887_34071 [Cichorium endivia]|nr:hypothetical protein L1887_34071 [Cichorium endivia]